MSEFGYFTYKPQVFLGILFTGSNASEVENITGYEVNETSPGVWEWGNVAVGYEPLYVGDYALRSGPRASYRPSGPTSYQPVDKPDVDYLTE